MAALGVRFVVFAFALSLHGLAGASSKVYWTDGGPPDMGNNSPSASAAEGHRYRSIRVVDGLDRKLNGSTIVLRVAAGRGGVGDRSGTKVEGGTGTPVQSIRSGSRTSAGDGLDSRIAALERQATVLSRDLRQELVMSQRIPKTRLALEALRTHTERLKADKLIETLHEQLRDHEADYAKARALSRRFAEKLNASRNAEGRVKSTVDDINTRLQEAQRAEKELERRSRSLVDRAKHPGVDNIDHSVPPGANTNTSVQKHVTRKGHVQPGPGNSSLNLQNGTRRANSSFTSVHRHTATTPIQSKKLRSTGTRRSQKKDAKHRKERRHAGVGDHHRFRETRQRKNGLVTALRRHTRAAVRPSKSAATAVRAAEHDLQHDVAEIRRQIARLSGLP